MKQYRTALFPFAALITAALAASAGAQQPFRLLAENADGVARVELDIAAYDALKQRQSVEVPGFVLGAGVRADLSLVQFSILAEDAQLITVDDGGERPAPRPDVTLWRGQVNGDAGSHVFLALSPHGSSGIIRAHNTTYIISSGPAGSMPTVAYDIASPAGAGITLADRTCAGAILPEGTAMPEPHAPQPYQPRVYSCKKVRIAVDCDQEFTSALFAGNATASQAYATSLLAASSEIYQRDMNLSLELAYLRTWTTTDPWTSTSTSNQLTQFRSYWQTNMGSVSRGLAHLFSGRNLGGGIAWLSAVCTTNGYAVSANMDGYFPYPLQNNHALNWDVMVITHEMGHNLGTGHTHDSYTPVIDNCGNGDCSQASSGTIMSYCHTCSGGMANIALTFGPRVIPVIRNYVDSLSASCGIPTTGDTAVSQHPAGTSVWPGGTINLSVATTGTAPTGYQWRRNSTNVVNSTRISGANTANLVITNAASGDGGSYTCVITTPCGEVTSNAATVGLFSCVSFLSQPQDRTVNAGNLVTLSALVGGSNPRTYVWRRNNQTIQANPRYSGLDTATLTISPAEPGDSGNYTLRVTNGCGSVTSSVAVLTVNSVCGSSDFNGDGDFGTDQDIEAFFACLSGTCCATCGSADFNADGDTGTDQDIEAFFRVLGGGTC